ETLIAHASLPDAVLEDIVRLEGRKAGIDDDWRPTSKCDCVQCRWDPSDGPMPTLPPEHECLFGGLDPRAALVIGQLAAVDDLAMPYWAAQARAQMQIAEWRR